MGDCKPQNCLKIPIPEECIKFCIERILRIARPEEKINILGLDEEISRAIYVAYNYSKKNINSFDDLAEHLSEAQIHQLITTFRNLNQLQLDYFVKKI